MGGRNPFAAVAEAARSESLGHIPEGSGTTDLPSLADAAADRHGVDRGLFRALVGQESSWNPRATSPVGAQGLAQLMPATAKGLGVTDPFDPKQSLDGGARYLRGMLDQFGGDARLALAAYNAGAGAVRKHGGIPPKETQRYVAKLLPTLGGRPAIVPSPPVSSAQPPKERPGGGPLVSRVLGTAAISATNSKKPAQGLDFGTLTGAAPLSSKAPYDPQAGLATNTSIAAQPPLSPARTKRPLPGKTTPVHFLANSNAPSPVNDRRRATPGDIERIMAGLEHRFGTDPLYQAHRPEYAYRLQRIARQTAQANGTPYTVGEAVDLVRQDLATRRANTEDVALEKKGLRPKARTGFGPETLPSYRGGQPIPPQRSGRWADKTSTAFPAAQYRIEDVFRISQPQSVSAEDTGLGPGAQWQRDANDAFARLKSGLSPLQPGETLGGRARDFLTAVRDASGAIVDAPKAGMRQASDEISQAFGNGRVDPRVYEDDPWSRNAGKIAGYGLYAIPYLNQVLGTAGLTNLATSFALDPEKTLKGVGRSANFLEPGISLEDRLYRGVNLAMLVMEGLRLKGKLTDTVAVQKLVHEHGMDLPTAKASVRAARQHMSDAAQGVEAERIAREGAPKVVRSRPAKVLNDFKNRARVEGAGLKQELLKPGSVNDVIDAHLAAKAGKTYGLSPLEAELLVRGSRAHLEKKGTGTALGDGGVRSEFRAAPRDVETLTQSAAARVMRARGSVIENGPVRPNGTAPFTPSGNPGGSAHDPYAGKPLRPGTTADQLALGGRGMDDLRAARGSSLLARTVARDLGRQGATDLTGQSATTHADFATAAQALRNGQKEVARFVFTKGGRVVGVVSGGLRLPGMASFAPKGDVTDLTARVRAQMAAHGADGVWLLHNHPSGDPTPSGDDLATTEGLAGAIPGFRGHVVIDSDRYAHIGIGPDGTARATVHRLPSASGPTTEPSPVLRAPARTPEELLKVAQTVKTRDGMGVLVATTPGGRVGDVREVGTADVLSALGQNAPQALSAVRRFALRARSTDLHLVLPNAAADAILTDPTRRASLRQALGKNLLSDVLRPDGRSLREELRMPRNGRYVLARRLSDAERAYAVREPSQEDPTLNTLPKGVLHARLDELNRVMRLTSGEDLSSQGVRTPNAPDTTLPNEIQRLTKMLKSMRSEKKLNPETAAMTQEIREIRDGLHATRQRIIALTSDGKTSNQELRDLEIKAIQQGRTKIASARRKKRLIERVGTLHLALQGGKEGAVAQRKEWEQKATFDRLSRPVPEDRPDLSANLPRKAWYAQLDRSERQGFLTSNQVEHLKKQWWTFATRWARANNRKPDAFFRRYGPKVFLDRVEASGKVPSRIDYRDPGPYAAMKKGPKAGVLHPADLLQSVRDDGKLFAAIAVGDRASVQDYVAADGTLHPQHGGGKLGARGVMARGGNARRGLVRNAYGRKFWEEEGKGADRQLREAAKESGGLVFHVLGARNQSLTSGGLSRVLDEMEGSLREDRTTVGEMLAEVRQVLEKVGVPMSIFEGRSSVDALILAFRILRGDTPSGMKSFVDTFDKRRKLVDLLTEKRRAKRMSIRSKAQIAEGINDPDYHGRNTGDIGAVGWIRHDESGPALSYGTFRNPTYPIAHPGVIYGDAPPDLSIYKAAKPDFEAWMERATEAHQAWASLSDNNRALVLSEIRTTKRENTPKVLAKYARQFGLEGLRLNKPTKYHYRRSLEVDKRAVELDLEYILDALRQRHDKH